MFVPNECREYGIGVAIYRIRCYMHHYVYSSVLKVQTSHNVQTRDFGTKSYTLIYFDLLLPTTLELLENISSALHGQ